MILFLDYRTERTLIWKLVFIYYSFHSSQTFENMNCSRVLNWILKIFLFLLCVSLIVLYSKFAINEYNLISDALEKRAFLIEKTIVYTLLLVCLIAGLFDGSFFLQSSSIGLFFIWMDTHKGKHDMLWTKDVQQIIFYVLFLSVIIVSQLLAFTLSSRRRTEFIPYFSATKPSTEFSFRRKLSRTGSGSSYTRNMNGNCESLIRRFDY